MEPADHTDRDPLVAAVDTIVAGLDTLQSAPINGLTLPELLAQLDRLKTVTWALPSVEHRIIGGLVTEGSLDAFGATSWADVLSTRLRISMPEARQRIADAEDLGPRNAMTGESLPPRLPETAAAQQHGQLGPEHLKVIRRFFKGLPDWVDYQTQEAAEKDLARVAAGFAPEGLRQAADRLAALINPDGKYSDSDRARRRYLALGRQDVDGMSKLTGLLDPEARASLDAVLAKWAAPGMCNVDDESPCVNGEAPEAAIQRDLRSEGQRNHDALKAAARSVLCSGVLGQHKGLPATIIVSTTLKELESGCGQAVTAGGTLLPMTDVIRMASHAHHYLVIFDDAGIPLHLGRSRRTASPGQRIVLYAKDRGCTRPGCTASGYQCEVHHAETDWAAGGQTNIDDLTLACGPDNRRVKPGGWKTRKRRKDGRTEWIPPPHLDSGQTRVNDYHHPEKFLVEDDEEDDG